MKILAACGLLYGYQSAKSVHSSLYIYVERIYGYAMKIYGVNGNVKAGKGS